MTQDGSAKNPLSRYKEEGGKESLYAGVAIRRGRVIDALCDWFETQHSRLKNSR